MNKLYSRYNQSKEEFRVEDSPFGSIFSDTPPTSRWITISDEEIDVDAINLPNAHTHTTATETVRRQESTIDAMERRAAEAVREQQPPTYGYASVRFPCGNCGYYLESVMAPNVTDTITCPNCHRTTELRVVLNERRRTGE